MPLPTDSTKHLFAHQITNGPVSLKLHGDAGAHFYAHDRRRHVQRGEHIARKRAFRSNGVTANRPNNVIFGQKSMAGRRCLFQSGYCEGTRSTQIDRGFQPRRHL
jgi:hypothetical protein